MAEDEWTGPQPAMILVRPQMGENIGAAARAMDGFPESESCGVFPVFPV